MKNKKFFKIGLIYFIAMICIALIFLLGSFGVAINEFISSGRFNKAFEKDINIEKIKEV